MQIKSNKTRAKLDNNLWYLGVWLSGKKWLLHHKHSALRSAICNDISLEKNCHIFNKTCGSAKHSNCWFAGMAEWHQLIWYKNSFTSLLMTVMLTFFYKHDWLLFLVHMPKTRCNAAFPSQMEKQRLVSRPEYIVSDTDYYVSNQSLSCFIGTSRQVWTLEDAKYITTNVQWQTTHPAT